MKNYRCTRPLGLVLVGISVSVCCLPAVAKDEMSPPPPSMAILPGAARYGTDPLHLLQTKKVQEELKIDADQQAKLAKLSEKYDRETAAKLGDMKMDGLTADEKEKKQQKIRETTDALVEASRKEVSKILNADQLNRLKQILLQVNGAEALQDKEVAKEIGLNHEQASKLNSLQTQTMEKLRGGLEKPRSSDPADVKKTLDANAKAADKIAKRSDAQADEVITGEQKQKLEKLRGAPFTLDRADVVGQ
jgi:hypothetical protein